MTSNDDNNSGPSSRDTFLRYIREVKYADELARKVDLQSSRPGDFQLNTMEECAWYWEQFKHLAFTSGALAGFASFALTRKGTALLISKRFKQKPSFNQVMVPSFCVAASVGTAVACWNRNDCVALVDAAARLPLRPGHSVTMDEYCPHVLSTLNEAFKTHPDTAMMKEMQKTIPGIMYVGIYNSCARRLLYDKILRHDQGWSEHDPASIPRSGVPEFKELLLMMKEAGLYNNGDSCSDYDHPKRDEKVGALEPVLANATNGNLESIPSDLTKKGKLKRNMMEAKLVLELVEAIELDTNNVGELGLQPEELRFLEWEGFKSRFNNLAWLQGALYGIGAFVALRMFTKGSDRLFQKVWADYESSKWALPRDAGLSSIVGTYVGSILGDEKKESVPDLALRSGRSSAVNEYCPLVIKHMDKAFDTHPHALLLKNPQTEYGQILVRARDNCERRLMYEAILRREQGLDNGEPVSIPKPGVPELDVLKSKKKSWRIDDNDGNDDSIQIMDAASAQRFVADHQDKKN